MDTATQIRTGTLKAAKAIIKEKLETNDSWLYRGVLAIYARQTAGEKSSRNTFNDNGIGFSAFDGKFLSWAAEMIMQFNNTPTQSRRYPTPFNDRVRDRVRKSMVKYSGQLARIAREQPSETRITQTSAA